MTPIDTAFVILGLVVATTLLARQFRAPSPVIFALTGMVAGVAWRLVPGVPVISMPPDLVLFAFLPPLLMVAAYALPLQALRRNLLPIGMLAIGLVLATMGVAAVIGHVFAGLPWAAAFVLGAIVAPPDPVAATAVAGRIGLRHRLVAILEGEGLVNDAIAIGAYGIALEAATSGTFSWSGALLTITISAPTGVAIGLALGWIAKRLRHRADSVPLEVAISLVTPYLAYHVAERTGASGVLAVVTLGFMLRRYTTEISKPAARLAARTVWSALRFASTSLVFLLLGLLIGEIVVEQPRWQLIGAASAVAAGVIALRMAWMYVVPSIAAALKLRGSPTTSWGERTVLGWAGMRGMVSLALALALPSALGGSSDTRTTIILITFAVIFGTLVLQGLTLVPLVDWLGVGDPDLERRDERRARRRARRIGILSIRRSLRDGAPDDALCEELVGRISNGAMGIAGRDPDESDPRECACMARAIEAQRGEVDRLRASGRLGETLSETLATELDIDAMRIGGESARLTESGD